MTDLTVGALPVRIDSGDRSHFLLALWDIPRGAVLILLFLVIALFRLSSANRASLGIALALAL